MSDWPDLERRYLMATFKRLPVVLVRGEGVRVWDENGRCYLDLVAGIAVNVLGHAHPAVVDAITSQCKQLIHVSNLYYSIPQLQLAESLVSNSCADKVFFANSGAEANEGAIKLARKWGKLHRGGAYEIISATGSFHGRTLATIAATGQSKFQASFTPMPDGFKTVPFNHLDALAAAITPNTCAVLLEAVQGESGVNIGSVEYLGGVRKLCDEQGLLLMLDEVQTGMGRTGALWAYQKYAIEPDVFTLAKGLGGGVPIGAVLARDHAACFTPSDHGSTFGGNPLACAAGFSTVQTILQDGLVANAEEMGKVFLEGLEALQKKHSCIEAVRGIGLMVAIDVVAEQAPRVVEVALSKGLIVNATGPGTIRMVPALTVTKDDLGQALALLDDTMQSI